MILITKYVYTNEFNLKQNNMEKNIDNNIIFETDSDSNILEIKFGELPKNLQDDDIIRVSHCMMYGNSTFLQINRNTNNMNDKDRIRPIPAGLFRDVDGDAILRAFKGCKITDETILAAIKLGYTTTEIQQLIAEKNSIKCRLDDGGWFDLNRATLVGEYKPTFLRFNLYLTETGKLILKYNRSVVAPKEYGSTSLQFFEDGYRIATDEDLKLFETINDKPNPDYDFPESERV